MTHAEVHLWGVRIGVVSIGQTAATAAAFEYDDAFVDAAIGIEPAPLRMPRSRGIYTFPEASNRTFSGLPGLLVDSLPDKFGTSLLNRWFAEQGRAPESVSAVERLLYIADRGMGALTFQPARTVIASAYDSALDLEDLTRLANAVAKRSEALHEALADAADTGTALDLIRVGTSAGGARAKALVAETPTGAYRPGHLVYDTPHRYWLLKFDGIEENADRDAVDPPGMTTVEYIYSIIARRAGITIPETDLREIGGRRHFLIERFDRVVAPQRTDRVHYASWCGSAHAHRDWPGAYGYEQLAAVCRRMGLPPGDLEQLFRRAVYNVVGVNHDDHTKNFGFLMNRRGQWRLAPAFDLTYACDPAGRWTKTHQTSINGRTADHTTTDLLAFAEHCDLTNRDAKRIISDVRSAFAEWAALAAEYNVPRRTADTVTRMLDETARSLDA